MKNKIIGIVAMVLSLFGLVAFAPAQDTYAADCETHFLGLKAWYDGLVDDKCNVKAPKDVFSSASEEDALKMFIWKIVMNSISMVLGVVGYLAILFVMWGGFQYMTAQGDPTKLAKGKKTITNSVIGLVIIMSASIISSTISGIIYNAKGDNFFLSVFNDAFFWAGVIAGIMVVYGGLQYITSTGNPQGIVKAKNTIIYSLIGLLVVVFAAAIVNMVVGAMGS